VNKETPIDISSNLVLGTSYHSAIEMHYRAKMQGEKPVSLDEMLHLFEQLILKEESQSFINWGRSNRVSEIQKAEGVFKVFLEGQQECDVVAVEEMFKLELEGLPPILGRIDLIEKDSSGALILVDFKTSATKPSQSHDPHIPSDIDASHQMTLYQIWAKRAFPSSNIGLRMDYLIKSSKTPRYMRLNTSRTQREEANLIQLIQRIWSQIQMAKAGVIEPVPQRSFRCNGCGYRNSCVA
jgi:CRISPR/Cas system-associated exonuclease Cas4 (RecB family)